MIRKLNIYRVTNYSDQKHLGFLFKKKKRFSSLSISCLSFSLSIVITIFFFYFFLLFFGRSMVLSLPLLPPSHLFSVVPLRFCFAHLLVFHNPLAVQVRRKESQACALLIVSVSSTTPSDIGYNISIVSPFFVHGPFQALLSNLL